MVRALLKRMTGLEPATTQFGNPTIAVSLGLIRTISCGGCGQAVVEGGQQHDRLLPWQPRHKQRSSAATNAATPATTANATTVPKLNGSAFSAEPIKTATPTRKAIPHLKTTHETSLRVMMGGRSTPRSSTLTRPVFLPSGTLTSALPTAKRRCLVAHGRRLCRSRVG
jgi:hypothetical protein